MSQRHTEFEDYSNGIRIARFLEKKILDESVIEAIGNRLYAEVGQRVLVIDCKQVEYLSSGILAKLITLVNRFKQASGAVILCNVRPDIYQVFMYTKLTTHFDIAETVEEAITKAHSRGFT